MSRGMTWLAQLSAQQQTHCKKRAVPNSTSQSTVSYSPTLHSNVFLSSLKGGTDILRKKITELDREIALNFTENMVITN